MVTLRFCVLRSDIYTRERRCDARERRFDTREKPSDKRAMRAGVWGWCGPPRRRRRRHPSPPPAPPPPISICPAPPMAPPLADFAESVAEEAGLSDMDFSALDDADFEDKAHHAAADTPGPMVMDAVSKKWMGNETEFERFHRIVADIGNDESVLPDQSVFHVSEDTVAMWRRDGEEHCRRFREGTTGEGIDIRDVAQQFSKAVERRKASS